MYSRHQFKVDALLVCAAVVIWFFWLAFFDGASKAR